MERSVQISKEKLVMERMYEFSDAHCHLDMYDNPSEIISKSRDDGVSTIITAGSNKSSNLKMSSIIGGGTFGVVGISPDFVGKDFDFIDELLGLIKKNKSIVGVGETGLDNTILESVPMKKQEEAFIKQLDLAVDYELPVVIHARKAIDTVIKILEEKNAKKVMFHFFEGDVQHAKTCEKHGWLVSVPPGDSSRRKRVIKALEINSIVAETDSPAVGKTPADVIKVVDYIAGIKGINPGEAGEIMTETIKDYFYI